MQDMGSNGEEKSFQFLGQWLNQGVNSFLWSSLGIPHFIFVFKTIVAFWYAKKAIVHFTQEWSTQYVCGFPDSRKKWLFSSTECSSYLYHTYTVHSRKSPNKCINTCIMYSMKNVTSLHLWAKQLIQCAHMVLLALPSHCISLLKTSDKAVFLSPFSYRQRAVTPDNWNYQDYTQSLWWNSNLNLVANQHAFLPFLSVSLFSRQRLKKSQQDQHGRILKSVHNARCWEILLTRH